MCWSPKVKTPKVSMPQNAPAPAPISETPAGIKFGDDEDKESSKSGIESVKITPDADNQNNSEQSTNFGAPVATGAKASGGFATGMIKKAAGSIRK